MFTSLDAPRNRGVLIYDDGVKADAFVADCRVGKRPKVVEQYLKSINLDGADEEKKQ